MRKPDALQAIDQNREIILHVNDRIWELAETAFQEFGSTRVFCDALRSLGFEVQEGVADIPTAFTGRFGKGRPVIGILAEYDALSGLSQKGGVAVRDPVAPGAPGHGCGHNCLGAGALAAAIGVKAYLESNPQIHGTVILYGCPGEEGGSGKAFMAREGLFDECDCAITWHPGQANVIVSGSSNANYQVAYRFKGVASHAAADPHLGRSALDAVELMNVGVQFLREHMIDQARIHYAITDAGGYSPNVVQPSAEVLYLIRSPKVAQVEELYQRVNAIADGAALMTGTRVEKDFIKACSNLVPNNVLEKLLYQNLTGIACPEYTDEEKAFAARIVDTYENKSDPKGLLVKMFGRGILEALADKLDGRPLNDFVLPYRSTETSMAGSTDVGDVSWICPTSQFLAVTTAMGTPGHSWQFVACNNTSIAHKGVLYAGKVLAGTAIDLLEDGSLVKAAKEELHRRLAPEGGRYVCPIPPGIKPRAIAPGD